MTDPAHTERIIEQGKALVRAIEALGTIEPTGPIEQALARLLLTAYKRRLRAIVAGVARLSYRGDTERIRAHQRQAGAAAGERGVARVVWLRVKTRHRSDPPPVLWTGG